MNLNVVNKEIHVGEIKVLQVTASSVVLIGDADTVACASSLETPPDTPFLAPLPPLGF